MSLLKSTVVVGGLTGVSRILGFAREVLLARLLGAGPVSDAFFIALRLPNLFRRVLAEGAFNSAFVPLYARRLEGGDPDGPAGETPEAAATRFASETYSALLALLIGLVLAMQIAMPLVIMGFAPGYFGDWGWIGRTSVLGLMMMPYIAFMSLMAMFGGVLNAHGRFAAFAFAPSLLNIVLVAMLVSPIGEAWAAARWLALGVLIAGALQCGLVYAGVRRRGIKLTLSRPRLTPGVKRVVALGVPGAVAAGVTQINIVVSQMIASLQEGAVSWLSYADRLYQLPLGMIGIAMGVALLPTLSRRLRADDVEGARASLNRAVEIAAFFTFPAAAALAVASTFWISALYERGAFDAADTAMTAPLLVAFAAGLPGFIAVKVFSPGFFAREDTKTPMRFAIVSVVANIALGLLLFWRFGVVGLAAATSAAGWINAALLGLALARARLFIPDARLLRRLPLLAAAAAVMGAGVWFAGREAIARTPEGILYDVAALATVGLMGLALYGVAALAVGGVRAGELRAAMRRG